MQRLNLRSLTTLIAFGAIFAVCGPVSAARAADNIVPFNPTNNATVNIPAGSAKLKVTFSTNNGFQARAVTLSLSGNNPTTVFQMDWDGILLMYTAEFAVSAGSYPNTTIKIEARKPSDSGGNPGQDDFLTLTGVTVVKQS